LPSLLSIVALVRVEIDSPRPLKCFKILLSKHLSSPRPLTQSEHLESEEMKKFQFMLLSEEIRLTSF
jgi:hypothetical protein